MSRRASVFARNNPGKRRVRFPDEVVFEEFVKEQDGEAVMAMLRRVSIDIDVNRINMAGMTALHQAVLDNNLMVVRLLLSHGANVNCIDDDSWSPLHAASANGHHQIAKYLITHGADRLAITDAGEKPIDLVDASDKQTNAIFLDDDFMKQKERKKTCPDGRTTPEWARDEKDLVQESYLSKGEILLPSSFLERRGHSLGTLSTISEGNFSVSEPKTRVVNSDKRKDSILDSIPDCTWETKSHGCHPILPKENTFLERQIQLWEEKKISLGVGKQVPNFEEEHKTEDNAQQEHPSSKKEAKDVLRRGRREGRLEHVSGSPAPEPINRLREKKR